LDADAKAASTNGHSMSVISDGLFKEMTPWSEQTRREALMAKAHDPEWFRSLRAGDPIAHEEWAAMRAIWREEEANG
jgi:hypothetical protein